MEISSICLMVEGGIYDTPAPLIGKKSLMAKNAFIKVNRIGNF